MINETIIGMSLTEIPCFARIYTRSKEDDNVFHRYDLNESYCSNWTTPHWNMHVSDRVVLTAEEVANENMEYIPLMDDYVSMGGKSSSFVHIPNMFEFSISEYSGVVRKFTNPAITIEVRDLTVDKILEYVNNINSDVYGCVQIDNISYSYVIGYNKHNAIKNLRKYLETFKPEIYKQCPATIMLMML